MPVTRARYHVNPENRVLRCTAGPNGTCRFAGATHFENMSRDEAQFMQESLGGAKLPAPVTAPEPAPRRTPAPRPGVTPRPVPAPARPLAPRPGAPRPGTQPRPAAPRPATPSGTAFPARDDSYGFVQAAPAVKAAPTEATLRWRATGVYLDDEATARALGRGQQAWEVVRRVNPDTAAQLRAAFRADIDDPRSDDEDAVYLHESENSSGTRLDTLTVQWGARSWAQEKVRFYHEHGDPYAQLDAWLAEVKP